MVDEFDGQSITNERADEIMYLMANSTRIKNLLDIEVTLFDHKWFDYRFENPVVSTYRFADAYKKAYAKAYARHYDRAKAEHKQGMKAVDIFDFGVANQNRTGLWQARQMADGLGIPYGFYLETAIELKLGRSSRSYIPRPTHLYDFDLLTGINHAWEEAIAGRLFLAENPLYDLERYAGNKAQDDYHEWLMRLISMRQAPAGLIARLVFNERRLPESKARARFGDEILEQAVAQSLY